MRFQHVAERLGGQTGDAHGLRLQLADLASRLAHSLGEPLPLGLHLAGGNMILDDLQLAGLAHMSRPDGHAWRNAETLEYDFPPALPALLIRLHRTCRPPAPPAHRPPVAPPARWPRSRRSEEHTSELQSLMRISYAVFCLK